MEQRVKYYEGRQPDGLIVASIFPALFTASYKRHFAGRLRKIDKTITGYSEVDARQRIIYGNPHGEIRGEITVTFIMDLDPVYEGDITDRLRGPND